jgi:hypothetical protein
MPNWILLLWLVSATPAATPAAAIGDVAQLSWLAGCWTGTKDGLVSEEHWTTPRGGGLVGMHKEVKNGRMTSFEFLRVAAAGKDSVCYFASPRGRPPTPFCAIELGRSRVVFENLAHDFPQRVLYWIDEKGRLNARIEGTIGGKLESEEWVWSRCKGE